MARLCRLFRQHRRLALHPLCEAWTRKDSVGVGDGAGVALRIDPGPGVAEVGERAGDGNVGYRQAFTNQITAFARDDGLQIFEDRRQIIELGLLYCLFVARPPEEARRNDPVEEYFRAASDEDRVGELIEPDRLAAKLRIARDQRRFGLLRFEIVDNRAR